MKPRIEWGTLIFSFALSASILHSGGFALVLLGTVAAYVGMTNVSR